VAGQHDRVSGQRVDLFANRSLQLIEVPATEEMQHPEFWISRLGGDPDRVIMTSQQIDALNRKNRTRKLEWKDINGALVTFDEELKNKGLFSGIMYRQEDPLKITSFPLTGNLNLNALTPGDTGSALSGLISN